MLSTANRFCSVWRSLICLLAAAVIFLTGVSKGQTQPSAPVDFDVVSIKLHMTSREVVDILRTRFGAKVDPVNGVNVVSTVGKYSPKSYVSKVLYRTKDFSLDIDFAEVFPASEARREGAYRITYVVPTKTDSDREAMKQRILGKYGSPTSKGVTGNDQWCQVPDCDLNQPMMEAGKLPLDPDFFVLLRDEGFRKRMEEAFNKSRTISPPL